MGSLQNSEASLHERYTTLEATYVLNNPKSQSAYQLATSSLPGGNTRSVLFYPPFPLYTSHASGSQIYDLDGHAYTDFLGEYTCGIFGHSHPIIIEAITAAAANGLNFGSQHVNEGRLASLIKARFKSIDLIRFTNSGTEATLMALAAAKIFTARKKVIVFEGGYHGGTFFFIFGNDPVNVPHEYLFARYNDTASVDKLVAEHKHDLAAIIVEPMLGSGGCVPATREFLSHLREVATATGAVLIFDEVMTSRLYSGGGVQTELETYPDMTTLGKYLGGGMSFGAFGGKKAIMDLFDPRTGTIRHAGTFNNNVLTMAAGSAGLERVFTQEKAKELHSRGEKLRNELNRVAKGTMMKVTGCGSLMAIHFTETSLDDVRTPADWVENTILGDMLHLSLLDKGYHIARRGFIALSLMISDEDIAKFIKVVVEFLDEHRAMVQL